jgi:hypothetical protein
MLWVLLFSFSFLFFIYYYFIVFLLASMVLVILSNLRFLLVVSLPGNESLYFPPGFDRNTASMDLVRRVTVQNLYARMFLEVPTGM